ncbi:hypothetical protein L7F22_062951 [Adiantum nelumboides]|nr:hypothetical protein [Adiantum nelumboides]
MNAVKEEAETESSSLAPPARRIDACEGDEDEEESMVATVLHVSLHAPLSTSPPKGQFAELKRTFSAVTWCAKSGLLACATEVCAKDSRSSASPFFWIPIHIIHPERPTEHAVFNITADSLCDCVQFLEWSPASCTRALLVGTSSGMVTIWTQPLQGTANAAQALNSWKCEHGWQQDQAVITKWLSGVAPYRWNPTTIGGLSKPSFEDRFISHQFRAPDERFYAYWQPCMWPLGIRLYIPGRQAPLGHLSGV